MANLIQIRQDFKSLELDCPQGRYKDMYIAVMGSTGAGKSSFIAACTGQDVVVGHELTSCSYDFGIFLL